MFSKLLGLESERKNAILNAALKEFANKGFDDASTNVIAKEAGISKPLMFHYVNNKKDFFLFLYDYCLDFLQKEYFDRVDLEERNLFERLRKTCLLKMQVIQRYPWIFDFVKIAVLTEPDTLKEELREKRKKVESNSIVKYYGDIDVSKFRDNLDINKAKQLIFWAVGGYAEQVLEKFKDSKFDSINLDNIQTEFDEYLSELRKVYYK